MVNNAKASLVGVKFLTNFNRQYCGYNIIRQICFFGNKLNKETIYNDECFMKPGTPVETTKRVGKSPFEQIYHPKPCNRNKKHIVGNSSRKQKKTC